MSMRRHRPPSSYTNGHGPDPPSPPGRAMPHPMPYPMPAPMPYPMPAPVPRTMPAPAHPVVPQYPVHPAHAPRHPLPTPQPTPHPSMPFPMAPMPSTMPFPMPTQTPSQPTHTVPDPQLGTVHVYPKFQEQKQRFVFVYGNLPLEVQVPSYGDVLLTCLQGQSGPFVETIAAIQPSSQKHLDKDPTSKRCIFFEPGSFYCSQQDYMLFAQSIRNGWQTKIGHEADKINQAIAPYNRRMQSQEDAISLQLPKYLHRRGNDSSSFFRVWGWGNQFGASMTQHIRGAQIFQGAMTPDHHVPDVIDDAFVQSIFAQNTTVVIPMQYRHEAHGQPAFVRHRNVDATRHASYAAVKETCDQLFKLSGQYDPAQVEHYLTSNMYYFINSVEKQGDVVYGMGRDVVSFLCNQGRHAFGIESWTLGADVSTLVGFQVNKTTRQPDSSSTLPYTIPMNELVFAYMKQTGKDTMVMVATPAQLFRVGASPMGQPTTINVAPISQYGQGR